jgi:phage terminase Nu1 subunit (DNA packaging protein)
MKQNPNLRGKTVGQVLNDLERKTGSGIVSLAQGGQIKHFVNGGMLFNDFMGGAPYEGFNANPITPEEIRANLEKLKQLKAAQQAQGIKPPVAPPSNAPRANAAPASTLSGGITEIAKALQSGQSNVPKNLRVGSGENTYPGMSDLNYYNELLAKSKEDPSYTPYQDEMKKLMASNPNLLKNNTVTPDLRGPLANAAKPSPALQVIANANANKPVAPPKIKVDPNFAEVDDKEMAGEKFEYGGNGADFGPTREEMEPIPKKEEEKNAFDKFLEEMQGRRAEIKGKKEEDKYMSLLAAGLGMMSGTSQFAGANIGKGALAGVQDYRDTQKQRAAELAAVEKEIGAGLHRKDVGEYYKSGILSKEDRAKLGQAQLMEKTQQNAYNTLERIEKDLMTRALASIKDTIPYTTGTPEKQQALLNSTYLGMKQRMLPYINNLQKKAGIEMPDMDAMLSSDDNKKSTAGWSLVK